MARDPEKKRLYMQRRHQEHREEFVAAMRVYRLENLEKHREHERAYNATHIEQRRAYWKEYDLERREAKRAYNRIYHASRSEAAKEYKRQYRQADPEKIKRLAHASYLRNRTAVLERSKVYGASYYAKNIDKVRKKHAEYAKANPDIFQASSVRRRARQKQAPRNDLTRQQWDMIKTHYGHRCVYCGKKFKRLTMDHITPLFKGGSHTLSNIVPACGSCNRKKHTGPPLKPVQPLLL